MTNNKKLKIFVVQHLPGVLPEAFNDRSIYIPIQAGAEIRGPLAGCLHDNDINKENISIYNTFINELTAYDWVYNNYDLRSLDYIGFCHYRRHFFIDPSELTPGVAYLPAIRFRQTVRAQYLEYHPAKWLDSIIERLLAKHPNLAKPLQTYLNQNTLYPCNIFIMDVDNFCYYWMFMRELIDFSIELHDLYRNEIEKLDEYGRRSFSFALERLSSFWFWYESLKGTLQVRIRAFTMF